MVEPPPLTAEQFQSALGVSRETMERLRAYADLLKRWQKAVNLIAPSTLPDLWRRHMMDSAQLARWLILEPSRLVDLGSGAGFPGLVLAILGGCTVELVESDSKKCTFLREVIRITEARAHVREMRIDTFSGPGFDVVTSRALAPLPRLLGYASRLLTPDGICLFLKGRRTEEELTEAGKEWNMTVERFPSQTEPRGWVIRVGDIRRVRPDR
jgi:16S rRNA (guanine527-N7)-methyltransferase